MQKGNVTVLPSEIYNYMKDKSVPGLGKSKCKKSLFGNTFKIYYKW